MKNFCLMPDQISAVKKALKEKGKEIVRMSKDERLQIFQDALKNGELAVELNNRFQKAVESPRKNALTKWLNTYITEEVKGTKEAKEKIEKSLVGDAERLFNKGILNEKVFDEFIKEAIRKKLGISVEVEEIGEIKRMVENLKEKAKSFDGNPNSEGTLEYLKTKKALENYIGNKSQAPFFEQLSGTFGRGNLLFSVASILTNIISNTSMSIVQKAKSLLVQNVGKSYLINGKMYESGANPELVTEFMKTSQKIFKETGVDITRIMALSDEAMVLGEKFSPSKYRLFKFYQDTIFKWGLGAPDVLFSSYNFASNLNVTSTIMARKELAQEGKEVTGEGVKQRAKEIFNEAVSLKEDRTPLAELLRQGATYSAQYATFQNNDRIATEKILEIRQAIDDIIPSLNLGLNLDPFVKTPVNVFMTSMDFTGLTAPQSLAILLKEMKKADPDPLVLEKSVDRLVSAGIGMTIAIIIASMIDDDDYMPDYVQATPMQREAQRNGNGVYYGIRIGNTWVSLVYFGPVGIPIAALMQARQNYAKSKSITTTGKVLESASAVGEAIVSAGSQLPLLNHVFSAIQFYENEYQETGDEKMIAYGREVVDQLVARSTPAITRTIGNMTDPYQRQKNYDLGFIDSVQESLAANFPISRETLEPRYSKLGEPLKNKPPIISFLFGSRANLQMNDPVWNELQRLNDTRESKGTFLYNAGTLKPLATAKKELPPDEYKDYNNAVQRIMKEEINKLITTESYQKANTETQEIMIENLRGNAVIKASKELGYQRFIKGWTPQKQKVE